MLELLNQLDGFSSEDRIKVLLHPGGNPWANLKFISHRYHPILVAFVWELT
jgi:hypothetical protein